MAKVEELLCTQKSSHWPKSVGEPENVSLSETRTARSELLLQLKHFREEMKL